MLASLINAGFFALAGHTTQGSAINSAVSNPKYVGLMNSDVNHNNQHGYIHLLTIPHRNTHSSASRSKVATRGIRLLPTHHSNSQQDMNVLLVPVKAPADSLSFLRRRSEIDSSRSCLASSNIQLLHGHEATPPTGSLLTPLFF